MSAIIHFGKQPSIWPTLEKAFGLKWVPGVTVTYGGEIYSYNDDIKPDVLVHEMVHVGQQKLMPADEFLDRYIADREFRIKMELPAYVIHNAYLRATMTDKAVLWTRLYTNLKSFAMTCDLSMDEADKMISHYHQPLILQR